VRLVFAHQVLRAQCNSFCAQGASSSRLELKQTVADLDEDGDTEMSVGAGAGAGAGASMRRVSSDGKAADAAPGRLFADLFLCSPSQLTD
jgi:hypothetical protein